MTDEREMCQCPTCGKSHWKLGNPPAGMFPVAQEAHKTRRPIWLRREGNYAVVLIEENREFREVIREHIGPIDGEFSHIWEDRT